jgi:K+-transporting ATPase KdpF subunit
LSSPARRCEARMIWLTVVVTLFLFGYLTAALLRPEWF